MGAVGQAGHHATVLQSSRVRSAHRGTSTQHPGGSRCRHPSLSSRRPPGLSPPACPAPPPDPRPPPQSLEHKPRRLVNGCPTRGTPGSSGRVHTGHEGLRRQGRPQSSGPSLRPRGPTSASAAPNTVVGGQHPRPRDASCGASAPEPTAPRGAQTPGLPPPPRPKGKRSRAGPEAASGSSFRPRGFGPRGFGPQASGLGLWASGLGKEQQGPRGDRGAGSSQPKHSREAPDPAVLGDMTVGHQASREHRDEGAAPPRQPRTLPSPGHLQPYLCLCPQCLARNRHSAKGSFTQTDPNSPEVHAPRTQGRPTVTLKQVTDKGHENRLDAAEMDMEAGAGRDAGPEAKAREQESGKETLS
ncbi:translation initiation factor IF-2-like [Canis lupus familiaris]|uniref:translation initiation factor IF-2-like n=1 Tax=Canis lupus familiaris TaxID=9615 RepID=UPI0018F65EE8|nr:translation initiation factor IF-2-like [Canis lupus familiaris]